MTSNSRSFGLWLRQRRKALDLTQERLAAAIDVSLPTIVKIEAGERRPSREVAELLARCLKVSAEELPDFMRLARAPLESHPATAPPTLSAAIQPAQFVATAGRAQAPEQPDHLPTPLTSLWAGSRRSPRFVTWCRALVRLPGGAGW